MNSFLRDISFPQWSQIWLRLWICPFIIFGTVCFIIIIIMFALLLFSQMPRGIIIRLNFKLILFSYIKIIYNLDLNPTFSIRKKNKTKLLLLCFSQQTYHVYPDFEQRQMLCHLPEPTSKPLLILLFLKVRYFKSPIVVPRSWFPLYIIVTESDLFV